MWEYRVSGVSLPGEWGLESEGLGTCGLAVGAVQSVLLCQPPAVGGG